MKLLRFKYLVLLLCGNLFAAENPENCRVVMARAIQSPPIETRAREITRGTGIFWKDVVPFLESPHAHQFSIAEIRALPKGLNLDNRFSKEFLLGGPEGNKAEALHALLKFQRILHSTSREQVTQLQTWIKSPSHAKYFVDHIQDFGTQGGNLLASLLKNNVYFKDAVLSPGSKTTLITQSFEKESSSKKITRYFRPAEITEEDWLKLSQDDRWRALTMARNGIKRWVPTHHYPQEMGPPDMDGFMPEIRSRSYEISPKILFSTLRKVSQDLGETHSIHAHTVFEIPREMADREARKFMEWFEDLNFHFLLGGMEEGLHPSDMVGPFILEPEDVEKPSDFFSSLYAFLSSRKFHSAGLRTGIYGKASQSSWERVGIELRDTTRNLDRLTSQLTSLRQSIKLARWKNRPAGRELIRNSWQKISRASVVDKLVQSGLPDHIALELEGASQRGFREGNTMALPFVPFENMRFPNYHSGRMVAPTTQQRQKIVEARRIYLEDLKKLGQELIEAENQNKRLHRDDIAIGLQYVLTEWAKRVHISELYGKY